MDTEFFARIFRQLLQFAFGWLAAKGLVSGSTAEVLTGDVLAAATAGYVAYRNTKTARIADVAAMPETKVIGTTVELAKAIPAQEVIPAVAIPKLTETLLSVARENAGK